MAPRILTYIDALIEYVLKKVEQRKDECHDILHVSIPGISIRKNIEALISALGTDHVTYDTTKDKLCINKSVLNAYQAASSPFEEDGVLSWSYVLGLYDIYAFLEDHTFGKCVFYQYADAPQYLNKLKAFLENDAGIPSVVTLSKRGDAELHVNGANCVDMLISMYDAVRKEEGTLIIYNKTKYETYCNFLNCDNSSIQTCKIWLCDPQAIMPKKARPSDVGYDLTIIKKIKDMTSNVVLYDTGVKVQPMHGMYAEVVPRSSLSKSGYMLANSVGIIDPSYTGNIMIALVKIDPSAKDIELPFRCCQLIFRRQLFVDVERMDTISVITETSRNEGGFGSSG